MDDATDAEPSVEADASADDTGPEPASTETTRPDADDPTEPPPADAEDAPTARRRRRTAAVAVLTIALGAGGLVGFPAEDSGDAERPTTVTLVGAFHTDLHDGEAFAPNVIPDPYKTSSTASLSPDESSVTYVVLRGDSLGDVVVRDLESDEVSTIISFNGMIDYAMPQWSVDGRRLHVDFGSNAEGPRYGVVELATGEVARIWAGGPDLRVAADAQGRDVRYWVEREKGVEVVRSDAMGAIVVTGVGTELRDRGLELGTLVGVSSDGSIACLLTNGAETISPFRRTRCTVVVRIDVPAPESVAGPSSTATDDPVHDDSVRPVVPA